MDSKAASLLFLASMCLFCSASMAFDITKILSNYPEFSNFNDFLSQTGLAQEINKRQTITVLAVNNGALDELSGRPVDVVKRILALHVILDYYDQQKLANLNNKSSILTTLFQTSGIANGQLGFLNVTKNPDGIVFGSAVPGATLTASLVKAVAAQPYNISILQVSDIIDASAIANAGAPNNSPTPPTPASAPAPPKNEKPAEPPVTGAPKKAPASPSPAKAPAKSSEGASPVSSPVAAPAPAPANESPSATVADAPKSGAVSRSIHVGGLSVALALVAGMLAF